MQTRAREAAADLCVEDKGFRGPSKAGRKEWGAEGPPSRRQLFMDTLHSPMTCPSASTAGLVAPKEPKGLAVL